MADNNRVKIPLFDPDSSALSAKAWVANVDMCRNAAGQNAQGQNNWTEQMTSNFAMMAMRGKAATWCENQRDNGVVAINAWNTLRPLFLARFHVPADIATKASVLAALKQKHDESVQDFRDRVEADVRLLFEDFPGPPPNAAGGVVAENTRLKTHVFESMTAIALANGFSNDIKEPINSQPAANLAALMTNATRVEASHKRGKAKQVAEVEVEAVQARANPGATQRGRGGFSNRGGGRGGSRGGRGGRNGGRFNGECWWCKKYGHPEKDCFQKKNGMPKVSVAMIANESNEAAAGNVYEQEQGEVGFIQAEDPLNPYVL